MSFRTKLVAIVGAAALAFFVLTLVNASIAARVKAQLTRVQALYIPRLELGPQLQGLFDTLLRGFQDAAAARDGDALVATREQKKAFLARLDNAQDAVDATDAQALRAAFDDYYNAAYDVSSRLIAAETGEGLVNAIAAMQDKKKQVTERLDKVTRFDRSELGLAFAKAAETQATATQVQTTISISCLALVIALSLWLGSGVLKSLAGLSAGFARFGKGEFSEHIGVTSNDEIGQAAKHANAMADNLQRLGQERDRIDWLKGGTAGLMQELRGELVPEEVARRAVSFLTPYVGAQVAALYVTDGSGFRLAGQHAHPDYYEGAPLPSFHRGQGLAGQAALSDALVVVKNPPPGYLSVRSGLGESAPACIVLLPLQLLGRAIGVLELAFWAAPSAAAEELLLATRESLALALDGARARNETQALLAETQQQADRLRAQEEEMRATNEELQSQQEELRQSNQELGQQTAELEAQRQTLEESNLELDQVRKHLELKAEELSTVSNYKSQFLTNMSHELRTPLNSMLLLSNLLAENAGRNLTEKQVEYSQTIHAAGKDLLALINQVLDLAKIESGKQSVHREVIALGDVIDRARRVFEPLAKDKGLQFSAALGPDVSATLLSDKQRLEQILTNLLGNAIKFTARGEVSLRIARPSAAVRFERAGLSADDALCFTIRDTGAGIAPADHARIFAPFEQVDGRVDRRYGGTGLGLTIARELAELLGGELQLDSTLGEGSTFRFYLPTADLALVAPRKPTAEQNSDDRHHLANAEEHLLLVEDDRRFAEGFGEIIHAQGFKYILADSAEAALRLAKQHKPIGIILDVKLPDSDGFSLLTRLQNDKDTASIPVHFVTAVDARPRGMAMGAIGYVTKPTTRSELVAVIDALISKHREHAKPQVLLVEADDAASESLVQLLGGENLPVRRAATAREALQLIARESFACVILDLSLPDMDGLEFLRLLEEERGADMPAIVVYTARPLSKVEAKRLNSYAEAIVLKEGLSAERLLSEVRLFIRRLKEKANKAPLLAVSEIKLDERRILVVDDDMRTVYALSALLRSKGAHVVVADTGLSALRALEENSTIEIVLMDIMMPEMDGYTAITKIRADKRFGKLPIIALTAKAMKGDEEKCLAVGATAYLPKPVDPTRLIALLDAQLATVKNAR